MLATWLARRVLRPAAVLLAVARFASVPSSAQDGKAGKSKQPDFIPAGYDDFQNILEQLGFMRREYREDRA